MTPSLPSTNSSTGKGLQQAATTVVGFFLGLVLVVWHVPGVPHVVVAYTQQHLLDVILVVGVPTGVASGVLTFVWNFLKKDIPNW